MELLSVLGLFLVALLLGYACGNIHGAFIIGMVFKHKDIREYGSKNSGTTNALRVFGFKIAVPVFIIDFLKAFLPIFFVVTLVKKCGFILTDYNYDVMSILRITTTMGAILGHNYPVLLQFKGGKGIASTLGALTALNVWCGLIACSIIALVIYITRYVSLASIIMVLTAPITLLIFTQNKYYVMCGLFLTVMGIYRHKENIKRLKQGNERKFGEKVEEKKEEKVEEKNDK